MAKAVLMISLTPGIGEASAILSVTFRVLISSASVVIVQGQGGVLPCERVVSWLGVRAPTSRREPEHDGHLQQVPEL